MDQGEINQSEWENPDNWSGPFSGFYSSTRDTRAWVPKRTPWMGWTINFGQPRGIWYFLALMAVVAVTAITTLCLVHAYVVPTPR